MNLEYAVGLMDFGTESHALKAHRRKRQNPGLVVVVSGPTVEWQIVGLHDGDIEPSDHDDVDHLDLYVFRAEFVTHRGGLPVPTVAPAGGRAGRTFPWGTERPRKPLIRPGTPLARFPVTAAEMRFAAVPGRALTVGDCFMHVDYELAPYPNPTGETKYQVHIGIEAEWAARSDRRVKNAFATIRMTRQQYANIYDCLAGIRP